MSWEKKPLRKMDLPEVERDVIDEEAAGAALKTWALKET